MKRIQRYVSYRKNMFLGAGNYSAAGTDTFTTKFNVIINGIYASLSCFDNITDQSIEGHTTLEFTGVVQSNPAIVNVLLNPVLVCGTGRTYFSPTHLNLPPGVTLTANIKSFLNAVTANVIVAFTYYTLAYLCPEDYLSLEAFDGA